MCKPLHTPECLRWHRIDFKGPPGGAPIALQQLAESVRGLFGTGLQACGLTYLSGPLAAVQSFRDPLGSVQERQQLPAPGTF